MHVSSQAMPCGCAVCAWSIRTNRASGNSKMLLVSANRRTWREITRQEEHMNDLLAQVIAAHGGLDRWNTLKKVTATVVAAGGVLSIKGPGDPPNPPHTTVLLH